MALDLARGREKAKETESEYACHPCICMHMHSHAKYIYIYIYIYTCMFTSTMILHMHAWRMHVGICMQGMYAPTYACMACMHKLLYACLIPCAPPPHIPQGGEGGGQDHEWGPFTRFKGLETFDSPPRPPPSLLPAHLPIPPHPTGGGICMAGRGGGEPRTLAHIYTYIYI